MKRIAVFPGSFDPFTLGHYNILMKAIKLFDEVIVGIGVNSAKTKYFSTERMIAGLKDSLSALPQVKIVVYEGLTSDFAKSHGANFLIRGIRNSADFEYERGIAEANKFLVKDLETVFLIADPEISFISSSIVRDIHRHGREIDSFLPYKI